MTATTGHLDILAWHGETHGEALIDFKTGRDIGAGWLQVGGYIQLLGDGVRPVIDYGGILHVPRVAVSKEPKATLELRDGGDLRQAWRTAKDRIDDGACGRDAPAVSGAALRAVLSQLPGANLKWQGLSRPRKRPKSWASRPSPLGCCAGRGRSKGAAKFGQAWMIPWPPKYIKRRGPGRPPTRRDE